MKGSLTFLFIILLSSSAFAIDISRLDPGDIVFKQGMGGVLFAKRVQVVRVDLTRNEVKVRDLKTGDTYWTNPVNLSSKTERDREIAVKTILGVAEGSRRVEAGKQRQQNTYAANARTWNPPKKKTGTVTQPKPKTYAANARVWNPPKSAAPKKSTSAPVKKISPMIASANTKKNNASGWNRTASGLQYRVIRPGYGSYPKASDTVKVHYSGTFLNGKEFDSSYKRGKSMSIPLKSTIKGWTEGLQLVKLGGRIELVIPPELGYGNKGFGTKIPPGSTLNYVVELLGVENK